MTLLARMMHGATPAGAGAARWTWTAHQGRRRARATARRQRRMDARQRHRAARARARARRRDWWWRRWAGFRPYALATAAMAALTAAGFCTTLVWGRGTGLVVGFTTAAVAFGLLEWRVHGD